MQIAYQQKGVFHKQFVFYHFTIQFKNCKYQSISSLRIKLHVCKRSALSFIMVLTVQVDLYVMHIHMLFVIEINVNKLTNKNHFIT